MRPHAAAPLGFTPLFDWSPPLRRKLSIISFTAASTALHALCFYLFQIIYPPTVALLPPPARVNVITGDSEDGRQLLRWIEAEDPALSAMTQRPPDAATVPLPAADHVPSYANWRPALRELPPLEPDLRIPSVQPPGPVPTRRAAEPRAPVRTPSRLQFDGETLGSPTMPAMQFAASRREVPRSAEFLVGISADGAVRYSFLQRASGDPALDAQARGVITLCRFPDAQTNGAGALIWTTATVNWGNDIAPPAAATPTP